MIGLYFPDLTDQGLEILGVQAILFGKRDPAAEPFYRWVAERSAAELDRREGLDVSDRLVPMPLIDEAARERILETIDRIAAGEFLRVNGMRPDSEISEGGKFARREAVTCFVCLQAELIRREPVEVH